MKTKAEKWVDLSNGERARLHVYIYDVLDTSVQGMTMLEQYEVYESMAFKLYVLKKAINELIEALKPKTKKELVFYIVFVMIGFILFNDELYNLIF